ncbi:ribose-5-phosphate isomerase RpiA [Planococcus sp. CPCC 101016]|uniref:ribose-5-phosphate isomerase RpiA n=1 Tax=Planococcus sp. CPCC 101016 TaxID=2599617 RepID=UPI0011B71F15|nr:ribose-5-phosphate isomerase RpiA [Planococcus sp. CPCC 101016]TWT05282.1 ribose-5-phosphate isomerase RpiA [Planococcus sp. CPCC 101016]
MEDMADAKKKEVGEKAVDYIKDGMIIGLGSGSTVYWMLKKLGERVKEGLTVKGVPSSLRTEGWAKEFGIPLTTLSESRHLDLAIDGADEVDPSFNLTKGGGGSLLREKLVNDAADQLIIVVDDSKLVDRLGAFPLPVEIVPFGWENTAEKIADLQCQPKLRRESGEVFVTNNGNYIVDCQFAEISDLHALHRNLKLILGVVETGLFINMANIVLASGENGVRILEKEELHE